jgi:Intra-flagellar transport protein 57
MATVGCYSSSIELCNNLMIIHSLSPLPIIPKPHFFINGNSTNAFLTFTKLAQYLLRLAGVEIVLDKYADPVSVSSTIMQQCTGSLGLAHLQPIPAASLRTGTGEACVAVLNALALKALDALQFKVQKPEVKIDSAMTNDDNEKEDEESEVGDDSAEKYGFNSISTMESSPVKKDLPQQPSSGPSKFSMQEWQLELERVSARLMINTSQTENTWRGHALDLNSKLGVIKQLKESTLASLQIVKGEVSNFLETVSKNEQQVNSLLDINKQRFLVDLKRQKDEAQANIKKFEDKIENGEAELADLQKNLESTKRDLEEWSDMATNTKPLIKIKEAIKTLTEETKAMDLRIAVVSHTLYEARNSRVAN